MTTRLSNATKNTALANLRSLLNNVVGFVGCPITDRSLMVELWNSKFPEDLVNSVRVLGTYNVDMGSGALTGETIRWCTELDGKVHSALVRLDEIGPLSADKMRSGVVQYAMALSQGLSIKVPHRLVHMDIVEGSSAMTRGVCHEITAENMSKVLGADLTDEVISWMKQTAQMREELVVANVALEEIFGMAATAGQIKRMVPDLLQYLPTAQRIAFEEQKRASTVPFEWAPFPKSKVDVMLTQINKGHLLQNMRKPNREQYSVESIDHCTWTRRDCQWA